MLQISGISKKYVTGDLVQHALKNVSLNLRDNEFVSILGPSGSGKTTLLNIIGGLDRYDSGDLVINGISTKKYHERDWDAYRNHTIGFVFQSYNLIPHQTVLANVELALTIGGISKKERRKRAQQALEAVGLGEQGHKRPNQMSGGQMQRVAIARALVNNPDILLADEPTGALDTETSVQVMELLKEVAKERLVVMVTHNPELAQEYSTRIVRLKDGHVVDDTNPYPIEDILNRPVESKRIGTAKMGYSTALALSFNNLRTKKGRTLLTSLAGSIGIIGIALILALSNGVNSYIDGIQRDTMTYYPLMIQEETMDMNQVMGGQIAGTSTESGGVSRSAREGIRMDQSHMAVQQMMNESTTSNDLVAFKKYLEDPQSEIRSYIGEMGIDYIYPVQFELYSYDANGRLVSSDADSRQLTEKGAWSEMITDYEHMQENMISMFTGTADQGVAANSMEIRIMEDGSVSKAVEENYELIHGEWPKAYNEVLLVVGADHTLDAEVMYQLGLITAQEYIETVETVEKGEELPQFQLDYADACEQTLYMLPSCERYLMMEDGAYVNQPDEALDLTVLMEKAEPLQITGIIKPVPDADNAFINEAIAYTSLLIDHIIEYTNQSPVTELHVDYAKPASISIYTDSFEDKEKVTECIADYNASVSEEQRITYTDYVKLMTSSLTSIVDVISCVLIAFVGVSLVVSCVMIGIITHISVMERTKEIGILRALGASKWNISQVFNAETMIIGFCAGVLGMGVSYLLTYPINALIERYLDAENLTTSISLTATAILIGISIVITLIGGWIPAQKAAKKDPVIALRTE